MSITRNVRIQFSFGDSADVDEDIYEIDLQVSWEALQSTETEIQKSLDEAVQNWVSKNVNYSWEEIGEECL